MIFLICFLVGVAVGGVLTWHLGRVAELKRKASAWDRERGG